MNNLVSRHDDEGFEGNAQSFGILAKLAVRFDKYPGLDLTRATLAACLKYPWFRDRDGHSRKTTKWGAYRTDSEDFTFARFNIDDDESKTAEAELMDWADDIAYSVHDIEDFHRCNAIPWREILSEEGRNKLVESAAGKNEKDKSKNTASLEQAHANLKSLIEGTAGNLINEPYEARQDQRRLIRVMTSQLIGHFVTSTRVRVPGRKNESCLILPDDIRDGVAILKHITRNYILSTAPLAAQQRGQERILSELFEDLYESKASKYLPRKFAYLFDPRSAPDHPSKSRLIADCICSLTETETMALHARLRGHASGSVLDPIVR